MNSGLTRNPDLFLQYQRPDIFYLTYIPGTSLSSSVLNLIKGHLFFCSDHQTKVLLTSNLRKAMLDLYFNLLLIVDYFLHF